MFMLRYAYKCLYADRVPQPLPRKWHMNYAKYTLCMNKSMYIKHTAQRSCSTRCHPLYARVHMCDRKVHLPTHKAPNAITRARTYSHPHALLSHITYIYIHLRLWNSHMYIYTLKWRIYLNLHLILSQKEKQKKITWVRKSITRTFSAWAKKTRPCRISCRNSLRPHFVTYFTLSIYVYIYSKCTRCTLEWENVCIKVLAVL